MPLYEFVCDNCGRRFEELRPAGRMDDPAECPRDSGSGHRVLSSFASFTTSDGYAESEPAAGGGCGGGCSNCACSAN